MSSWQPAITVILPVKDREAWIAEAIESVIAESYPRLELIVIDGGSADRSAEIASSYEQVTLLPQRSEGLTRAWNEGIEAAGGELIAFLDSDDRWLPGKLESQLELLQRRPELGGAIGAVRFVLPQGAEPPPGMRANLLEGEHTAPMPGTLLARSDVFDRVGLFDPSYEVAPDVDWFARVKDAGIELGAVPEVILEKRFHEDNLSHQRPDVYRSEMARALGDSVRRQRAR